MRTLTLVYVKSTKNTTVYGEQTKPGTTPILPQVYLNTAELEKDFGSAPGSITITINS